MLRTFVLCTIVFLIFSACEKQSINPVPQNLDYRDSFIVGTYTGQMAKSEFKGNVNPSLPALIDWDSSYAGALIITKDTLPDGVIVQYPNGTQIAIPKVMESANYYKFNTGYGTGAPYYCSYNVVLEIFTDKDSISYEATNFQYLDSGGNIILRSSDQFIGKKE